jgi:hypothetical protein
VTAAVHSRGDGRLERVAVAVPVRAPPERVNAALAEPQRWRALPGWREIKSLGTQWQVDTNLPFVDLDALWAVQPGSPFRAVAVGGSERGAVLGWDVLPAATGALAVFSLHPRLEKAGYIPRKFIEAEPLLEQGLSLGLAFVDAVSLARAVARPAQGAQ